MSLPVSCRNEVFKRASDGLSLTREAGQSDPAARKIERDGAWLIKHVEVRVGGEQGEGQRRSFVVAGYQHHRDSGVGHLEQGFEGEADKLGLHLGSEEEIAAVNDEIDLAMPGRRQCGAGVGEKVRAATAAFNSGPQWKVETEVGIGQQEDTEGQGTAAVVSLRWRS